MNCKAQFGLAVKIYLVLRLMLNKTAIWLVNMESQNTQISPRRTCNPCGSTMLISSRYHRLLTNNVKVKKNSKKDNMGPLKTCFKKVYYLMKKIYLCIQMTIALS